MQAGMDPLIALLTRLSCANCCTTAHMHVKMSAHTRPQQQNCYSFCLHNVQRQGKQGRMLERLFQAHAAVSVFYGLSGYLACCAAYGKSEACAVA